MKKNQNCGKDLVSFNLQMGLSIKVKRWMSNTMEEVEWLMLMEIFTKATGKTEKPTAMEFLLTLMEACTRVNG